MTETFHSRDRRTLSTLYAYWTCGAITCIFIHQMTLHGWCGKYCVSCRHFPRAFSLYPIVVLGAVIFIYLLFQFHPWVKTNTWTGYGHQFLQRHEYSANMLLWIVRILIENWRRYFSCFCCSFFSYVSFFLWSFIRLEGRLKLLLSFSFVLSMAEENHQHAAILFLSSADSLSSVCPRFFDAD